jgi:hypothetical protein
MQLKEHQFISEEIMREAIDNRNRYDSKEVRLSAIGLCQRKQILGAIEGTSPIDFTYDEGGHALQERLFNRIKEKFPQAQEEVEIKHPFGSGHADIVIPELNLIVEVKTCKDEAFSYDLPKEAHVLQVKAQMLFSGIKNSEIIYLCRAHFGEHFKAFNVPFPDGEALEIQDKLAVVAEGIATNTPTPVPFDSPSWQCKYRTSEGEISCEFYSKCWNGKTDNPVNAIVPTDEKQLAMLNTFGDFFEAWSVAKENFEQFDAKKKSLERKLVDVIGDFEVIENERFRIKRSTVTREIPDYKGYLASEGLILPDEYKRSATYDRFSVKLKGGKNEQAI